MNKTNGWAADTIENEGVAYAVMHYCDGSSFKDVETALLWDAAADALARLVDHLRRETGREIDV